MKLGIIGAGVLAEEIVKSFIKNRTVSSSDVSVFDLDHEKLNYWAGTYDIIPCTDMEDVIKSCQILFICVPGKDYPKLLASMDYLLRTYRPLVVSFARGRCLEEIENLMDFIPPMARIMTNLNVGIGMGITAYCFNELVTDGQKATLIEMFSTTGQLVEIDESRMDTFGAVSTLASVIACKLIETLTSCGMLSGLTKEIAYKTAVQAIYGTVKSLSDGNIDIHTQIGKLCHPESMALEALLSLSENGFDNSVIKGYKISDFNKN